MPMSILRFLFLSDHLRLLPGQQNRQFLFHARRDRQNLFHRTFNVLARNIFNDQFALLRIGEKLRIGERFLQRRAQRQQSVFGVFGGTIRGR